MNIPFFNTANTLFRSRLYQTGSSIIFGGTTFFDETAPDIFGLYGGLTNSYNLITAHATINNYLQINVRNLSTGSSVSSDIVAVTPLGTEDFGYIDMGINSDNYVGNRIYDLPGDGYLYTTGSNLVVGTSTANSNVTIFAGGDTYANRKLTLKASNQHEITGSVNISGSILPSNGV